jgi:hypothetical protein
MITVACGPFLQEKGVVIMGVSSSRVSRVLMRGPLAPFADEFRSGLLACGYTSLTAVNQLRQAGRLSIWLDERWLGAADVSEERISRFLDFQRAGGRHRSQWSRPGLLRVLDVLRQAGTVPAARPSAPPPARDLLLESCRPRSHHPPSRTSSGARRSAARCPAAPRHVRRSCGPMGGLRGRRRRRAVRKRSTAGRCQIGPRRRGRHRYGGGRSHGRFESVALRA